MRNKYNRKEQKKTRIKKRFKIESTQQNYDETQKQVKTHPNQRCLPGQSSEKQGCFAFVIAFVTYLLIAFVQKGGF